MPKSKNIRGGTQAQPKQIASDLPRSDPKFQASDDEQTVVNEWLQRITRAEDNTERKAWFDDLPKLRGYVYGTVHKDDSGSTLTRTNLVFATLAAMMPHLYAKNPDIGVTPSAGCPDSRLPTVKDFCRAADGVIAQMFVKEGKLKQRAKSNIRSAQATSYGVMKLVFQDDLHGDPIILRRIQDAQDNVARLEALAREKDQDVKALALQRDEQKALIEGLVSGNEVKHYKGFAIDRLRSENFLILDDSITEFDEYVDAQALGHMVFMTPQAFETKFGFKPTGATEYNQPVPAKDQGTPPATSDGGKPVKYICVVEIWDKEAQVVRTVAKGLKRWVREPYAPANTPQRWYPFYALGFNLVEGRWRPISDVELLMKLQDEYNTTRTNFADAREDAVPLRVFRKAGGLTEEDIKALSKKRRNRDWVGIEGSPTIPIKDDIQQLEGLKIDPQAYDVSLIRNDMDLVAGMSDASRANLIKPKTATEAEIMQQSLGLRVSERRDTNEDLLSEMAEAALEIALRTLTRGEVAQIVGEEVAQAWPEGSDVASIFALVDVSVRAGSSGKPDMAKEREQWTQLVPVVKETMTAVAELRQQGQYELADATVELLRETLRRFGERIDVDSLIPPVEKGEDGKPAAQARAAEQVTQLTGQLQEAQVALQQCQEALTKAQAGEASKIAQTEADKAAGEAELKAKMETERYLGLLNAAVKLMGENASSEREAAAASAAGDEQRAQKLKEGSDMAGVLKTLTETMTALSAVADRLAEAGVAGGAGRPTA